MKSCLVVDDSSVVRKVARRILEDLDYIVDEAEDGEEALERCQREMPDAVLVDWQMPILDGIGFIKALRGYEGGDRPRVVFCALQNDVGLIAMARRAGANDHMFKPFDRDMLEAKFTPEDVA